MKLTFGEVELIQKDFIEDYWKDYPLNDLGITYINSVGISTLQTLSDLGESVEMGENDNLEDFCLEVTYVDKPQLELPSKYKGIRVFYKKSEGFTPF